MFFNINVFVILVCNKKNTKLIKILNNRKDIRKLKLLNNRKTNKMLGR